jgi:hypothetical protein
VDYALGVQVVRPEKTEFLGVYNSAGERVARLGVPAGADAAQFQLSAVSGAGFTATMPLGASGTASVGWSGLNDEGQPVANGSYLIRAETTGLSRSEPFTLLRGPAGDGALIAGPDPLQGDVDWQLRFDPRPGAWARAELYDLAGERVRLAEGPANGALRLASQGLSGGVYLLDFSVNGADGYRQRRQLALVR